MTLIQSDGRVRGDQIRDCNEINILETDEKKAEKLEMWIAKQVGEKLVAAYPNREWNIKVSVRSNMMVVICPSVSREKGYHLRLDRTILELQGLAVKAAGEILERHNVSRGRIFDPTSVDSLKRDLKDNVIAPDAKADPIHVAPRKD